MARLNLHFHQRRKLRSYARRAGHEQQSTGLLHLIFRIPSAHKTPAKAEENLHFSSLSTSVPDASEEEWILPRPKNMPPACFCTSVRTGAGLPNPIIHKNNGYPKGYPLFLWLNYHKLIQCTAPPKDAPSVFECVLWYSIKKEPTTSLLRYAGSVFYSFTKS